jgi:hypothetical protein
MLLSRILKNVIIIYNELITYSQKCKILLISLFILFSKNENMLLTRVYIGSNVYKEIFNKNI